MNLFQTKKKQIIYISCICILLIFIGCAPISEKSQFKCNFLPGTEKPPDWVTGDCQIEGYYVGIGQAEKKQGMKAETLISRAKEIALGNLSENIKVEVRSKLEMSSSQNQRDDHISFFSNIRHDLSTQSNMTMYNIKQDALWLDTEKCIVWVRMKMEKSLVQNLFMISQAESNYEMAKNKQLPVYQRSRYIEKSINIMQSVDFSNIKLHETSEMYLKKYNALRSELSSMTEGRQMIYFVKAPKIIQQQVYSDFVQRLISNHPWLSAWYDKNLTCEFLIDCMDMAKLNNAALMVFLELKVITTKQDMGFIEGELEIILSFYDVNTKEILFKHTTEKTKNISYDINHINWNKMIDSLFVNHNFDKYIEYLSKTGSLFRTFNRTENMNTRH